MYTYTGYLNADCLCVRDCNCLTDSVENFCRRLSALKRLLPKPNALANSIFIFSYHEPIHDLCQSTQATTTWHAVLYQCVRAKLMLQKMRFMKIYTLKTFSRSRTIKLRRPFTCKLPRDDGRACSNVYTMYT